MIENDIKVQSILENVLVTDILIRTVPHEIVFTKYEQELNN
jgi:hypothetical protein